MRTIGPGRRVSASGLGLQAAVGGGGGLTIFVVQFVDLEGEAALLKNLVVGFIPGYVDSAGNFFFLVTALGDAPLAQRRQLGTRETGQRMKIQTIDG